MSTTILVMITIDAGKICLDSGLTEITRLCPPALRNLRVRDLLTHQSGLPAWRPYYLNPALSDPGRLAAAIASEPRSGAPGDLTVYSDLNFILLGLILERIWGKSLKDLFSELIAAPLGLRLTGYRPDPLTSGVAPTEDGFRLGGPLDFPGVPVLGPVPLGRVHDDNAAALGGVAGQAGLFGAAPELWLIIRDLSRSLRGDKGLLVKKNTLNAFLQARPPRVGGPVRAAGFDIGQGALAEARGHLGYTGGSVWWDCQGDRAYILLCNRVQPTARRSKMEAFRRELESILWEV
jgi:CubicO group peptidase (beta-lactamase class C family)